MSDNAVTSTSRRSTAPDHTTGQAVEGAHTSHDESGVHTPAAFVSGDTQLDAACLRRLAEARHTAADELGQLTPTNSG